MDTHGENIMTLKIPDTQANALLVKARKALNDHRARAKKAGATLNYGLIDLQQLLANNPLCYYCRLPVAFDASIDHKTPITRGGPWTYLLGNLCISCSRCNRLKGMLTAEEFTQLRLALELLPPVARADIERRLLAGGKRYASSRRKGA